MEWVQPLLLVVIAGLIAWLIPLTYRMLDTLNRIADSSNGSRHAYAALTNYSTWMYKDGAWKVIESKIEPGFVPGEPPRRPGSYEGEIIRRPAVRGAGTL